MKIFKQHPKGKLLILVFSIISGSLFAQTSNLANNNKQQSKTIDLAETSSGNKLVLLQIGEKQDGKPAIFVAANMQGNNPTATIGATWLSNAIGKDPNLHSIANWYILPCGNPDVLLNRVQNRVKWDSPTNFTQVNNDNDELTDEDGPDDLNKDGIISQMLVKHPLGEYVKDSIDSRIVRLADLSKGERGIYKLLIEGIDNDGDGLYNEDPIGGVNIDRNFTYGYEPFIPEHGKWNGSEVESNAIMKFYAEHPEIALTIVIGENNTLLFPPKLDSKNKSVEKIKVPSYYANRIGVDDKKTHTPEELKKAIAENMEDKEYGIRIFKSLLNTNEPKAYQKGDLGYHQQISSAFQKHLKDKKQNIEFEKPTPWANGSFEKFAYFQYGNPTFSLNLLPIPKNKEKEKTELAKFLAYADSTNLDVFLDWQAIEHPDFDSVEIGGLKPFAMTTRPADSIQSKIENQLSFLFQIPEMLPLFSMETELKTKGKGLIVLDVFISNNGTLPYPTAMGYRNNKPAPVILKLNGKVDLLSGKKRTTVPTLKAGETIKISYLISKTKEKEIELQLEAKSVRTKNPIQKIKL